MKAMISHYLSTGQGFVVVYSVTSQRSLERAKQLGQEILEIKDATSFPIVLAGNKCDVPADVREVTTEEGQQVAKLINAKVKITFTLT